MSITLNCPNCREEFEAEPMEDSLCPGCNEPFGWDIEYFQLDEFTSDSWFVPYWENY